MGRMILPMHTAAEYRAMAEECFQWAETAFNDEVRANYLGIAQIWLQAAARLDGGLPVRGKVIPEHSNGKWAGGICLRPLPTPRI
jgi:hypothetical protein